MESKSICHFENTDKDLLQTWSKLLDTIKLYSNKLINDCFFSIRVKFVVKVLNQISQESKLSKYDEKIFEYFHHLMWYYYKTINLYEQNKDSITNTVIKDIMNGICTILSAQLNQFEENQQNEYIHMYRITTKNPIRLEKDEIITEAKNQVLKTISSVNDEFIKSQTEFCYSFVLPNVLNSEDNHSTYINLLKDIYKAIIDNTIDLLYQAYCKITSDSIDKLNNFQFRKAANFYYESINQEKENLESIMKFQINALEDELKKANIEIVNQILGTLVEAYQHLGKEIEALAIYFKRIENITKEIKLLTKQEFEDYILTEGFKNINDLSSREFASDIKILNDNINEAKELFKQDLNNIVEEIIFCFNQKNDIKSELNNFIENKRIMIDEFLNCFIDIKNYYDKNKDSLFDNPYSEILKGIYETIEIKIDSLKENTDIFLEAISNISNNSNFNLSQQTKQKIQSDTLKQVYYNQYDSFNDLIESIYNAVNSHELLVKYMDNINKQKNLKLNQVNKSYLSFLKGNLLFELTTYEEILNYSISRLRQSDIDVINDFVNFIDSISSKIEQLLSKYNIETIKPKPYDLFDGKSHEILMAEKNKDFEKGQIIKLMNTGYKYNNIVIVRANVIAAK